MRKVRWVKIAGLGVAVVLAVGLVSFLIRVIEMVMVLGAIMIVVAIGLWLYRALESAQHDKLQKRNAKAARIAADRTRARVEEELERLKQDMA